MKKSRAIVIGAGVAGLCTAKVLSPYFSSVVIIDKDEQIGSSNPRRGVPQGAHLHVLLKKGQDLLRSIFPHIDQSFAKAGCPKIDWAQDTQWESKTGVFPRYSSPIQTYSFSRPFLESVIYSLVLQIPNVIFVKDHIESLKSFDGSDLIVLAGGQNFPINHFLNLPVDLLAQHLPIQISYRSVVFETSSLNFRGYKQYYYQLAPPQDLLGAVICPIENNRSVATIVQHGAPENLKVDLSGFMKLAEKVPNGEFYNILKNGQPLSEVSAFYKSNMYMRRPDKVLNFPENILCIGDTFCSLNPVFGQGMTSTLLQIKLLSELLKKNGPQLRSKQFHQKSAATLRLPYLLSKMGSNTQPDFSYRYLKSYLARCQRSPKMHRKFLGVLHLENSYSSLIDVPSLSQALGQALFTEQV